LRYQNPLLFAGRIGKAGELVVEGDPNKNLDPVTTTGESQGTFTVLALNPQTSKFYIGGIPSTSRVSICPRLINQALLY
jgi:hypothetical protein